MKRYDQLRDIIAFARPERIIEIGTHSGKSAEMMCREALRYNSKVSYVGYDLFWEADETTNSEEMNGKGAGSLEKASDRLKAIKAEHPEFSYELVPGNTRKTLHGTDQRADLVFIDGGHSVETIRGDYEAVKGSRVVVFDDYYTGMKASGLDIRKFGCNAVLAGVPHEVLPEEDRIKGGTGVRFAVVGYSTKWRKAIERVRKDDGIKSVSLWRGSPVEPADLICACNTFETAPDTDKALEQVRHLVGRKLFFAIRADFRSLAWWRSKMEEYFQLLEWFAPNEHEVVGTAMPLFVVGEWNAKGVLNDDQRFEHTKANCAVISKRVEQHPEPNGRKAVIVCYGPSLLETWPNVTAERRFADADVFSVSGAHDFMIRRGIVPDYHVECDPRPHKAANLNNPREGVKYYIASCCHPDLVDKLKGYDTSLWHLCNGQESFRIMEEIESEHEQFLITGGGSVGLRSISLAYAMGYREFAIYGMDCSFSGERQWAGPHKGKKQKTIKVRCGDKWFETSPVLVTYARHFIDTVQRATGANFNLYGDGLLQAMCKAMTAQPNQGEAA